MHAFQDFIQIDLCPSDRNNFVSIHYEFILYCNYYKIIAVISSFNFLLKYTSYIFYPQKIIELMKY